MRYTYTEEQKRAVWRKSEGRCTYGQRMRVNLSDHGKTWQIEHSNPDGVDDLRNWRVACVHHNLQKQDRTRQEYAELIRQNLADYECDY